MPVCVCAYKLATLIYVPLSLPGMLVTYKCVRRRQPVPPSYERLGCFVPGCDSLEPPPRPAPSAPLFRPGLGVRVGWSGVGGQGGKPGAETVTAAWGQELAEVPPVNLALCLFLWGEGLHEGSTVAWKEEEVRSEGGGFQAETGNIPDVLAWASPSPS